MCTGLKDLIKSTWLRACCSRHYGDVIVFEKLRFLAGGQFRRISVDVKPNRRKKSCVFKIIWRGTDSLNPEISKYCVICGL